MFLQPENNTNAMCFSSKEDLFMIGTARMIYDAMLRAIAEGAEMSVAFQSGETSISLSQKEQANERETVDN